MAGYLRRGGYDSPGSSGRSQINTSARTAAALAGLGNRTTQYESKFTWFVLMTALVAVRHCSTHIIYSKRGLRCTSACQRRMPEHDLFVDPQASGGLMFGYAGSCVHSLPC